VGEASYAIQEQPSYAAAFARTEDVVEDVLVQVCGVFFSKRCCNGCWDLVRMLCWSCFPHAR
jgi:hypothetical protein